MTWHHDSSSHEHVLGLGSLFWKRITPPLFTILLVKFLLYMHWPVKNHCNMYLLIWKYDLLKYSWSMAISYIMCSEALILCLLVEGFQWKTALMYSLLPSDLLVNGLTVNEKNYTSFPFPLFYKVLTENIRIINNCYRRGWYIPSTY